MQNANKQVYLMRGLPACGKSQTACRLAGERGIVLETDQYFYTQVGDDPAGYEHRGAMTNRPDHAPNDDSNEMIYAFFEHFLKPSR